MTDSVKIGFGLTSTVLKSKSDPSLRFILAIDTLKQQIAELMTGQSSTRQAQIEELRKKLIDAAKEANELR